MRKKRILSEEHKNKIREALLGNKNCLGNILSSSHKRNIKNSCKGGNKTSYKKGCESSYGMKGKQHTKKHNEGMSELMQGKNKGSKNGNWKGGISYNKGYGKHKISLKQEGCVWHHVNMMFMVATPKIIHQKCNHYILGTQGIHGHYLEGVLG